MLKGKPITPDPTITLTLTAAETALLLNSAAAAIGLINRNAPVTLAVLPELREAFAHLGPVGYQTLTHRIAHLSSIAFAGICEVAGVDLETGEEVPHDCAA